MNATDELRQLLDERGVEYRVSATGYSIDIGPKMTAYANRTDTTLDVSLRGVSPEQAIEATLGAGTCKADETDTIKCWVKCKDEPSTEHMELIHVMECSACGGTYEHVNGAYEFCPRCGARVMEVDE